MYCTDLPTLATQASQVLTVPCRCAFSFFFFIFSLFFFAKLVCLPPPGYPMPHSTIARRRRQSRFGLGPYFARLTPPPQWRRTRKPFVVHAILNVAMRAMVHDGA